MKLRVSRLLGRHWRCMHTRIVNARQALFQDANARVAIGSFFGKKTAIAARPGLAVIETKNMPGEMMQPRAVTQIPFGVGRITLKNLFARWRAHVVSKNTCVHFRQQIRIVIGRPAQHYPVDTGEMRLGFNQSFDAAIDANLKPGMDVFQTVNPVIVERRYWERP